MDLIIGFGKRKGEKINQKERSLKAWEITTDGIKSISLFLGGGRDAGTGMKAMTKQNRFDHQKYLHPDAMISGPWLRPWSKSQAEIFPRFVYGFLLGISFALCFQWWR